MTTTGSVVAVLHEAKDEAEAAAIGPGGALGTRPGSSPFNDSSSSPDLDEGHLISDEYGGDDDDLHVVNDDDDDIEDDDDDDYGDYEADYLSTLRCLSSPSKRDSLDEGYDPDEILQIVVHDDGKKVDFFQTNSVWSDHSLRWHDQGQGHEDALNDFLADSYDPSRDGRSDGVRPVDILADRQGSLSETMASSPERLSAETPALGDGSYEFVEYEEEPKVRFVDVMDPAGSSRSDDNQDVVMKPLTPDGGDQDSLFDQMAREGFQSPPKAPSGGSRRVEGRTGPKKTVSFEGADPGSSQHREADRAPQVAPKGSGSSGDDNDVVMKPLSFDSDQAVHRELSRKLDPTSEEDPADDGEEGLQGSLGDRDPRTTIQRGRITDSYSSRDNSDVVMEPLSFDSDMAVFNQLVRETSGFQVLAKSSDEDEGQRKGRLGPHKKMVSFEGSSNEANLEARTESSSDKPLPVASRGPRDSSRDDSDVVMRPLSFDSDQAVYREILHTVEAKTPSSSTQSNGATNLMSLVSSSPMTNSDIVVFKELMKAKKGCSPSPPGPLRPRAMMGDNGEEDLQEDQEPEGSVVMIRKKPMHHLDNRQFRTNRPKTSRLRRQLPVPTQGQVGAVGLSSMDSDKAVAAELISQCLMDMGGIPSPTSASSVERLLADIRETGNGDLCSLSQSSEAGSASLSSEGQRPPQPCSSPIHFPNSSNVSALGSSCAEAIVGAVDTVGGKKRPGSAASVRLREHCSLKGTTCNCSPQVVADKDRTGKTAAHYCAENQAIACINQIVSSDPSIINEKDEEGYTPLHLAVISGNKVIVAYLISKGADVNAADHEAHSAVHWATVCGELETLKLLVQAGANLDTPDVHGAYPIHYAAQMCGNQSVEMSVDSRVGLTVLRSLVKHGAKVDVKDKIGREPIMWAASSGSSDAVLSLMSAGAPVAGTDKDGLTPMHCAASRGHVDCVDTLAGLCNAEVDIKDNNGSTPLFYSVTLGHVSTSELLLKKYSADSNVQDRKGRSAAHCGAGKGQLDTLKLLQKHGGNLWLKNHKGDFPLHEAVHSGRKDLVKWLLDLHPEAVSAPNEDGRTPLHVAAISNYLEMCKILIDKGADVNAITRNTKGHLMTPLDAALYRGNKGCAKYIQLQGGLPASKITGKSALQRALSRALDASKMMNKDLNVLKTTIKEEGPEDTETTAKIEDDSVANDQGGVSDPDLQGASNASMVTVLHIPQPHGADDGTNQIPKPPEVSQSATQTEELETTDQEIQAEVQICDEDRDQVEEDQCKEEVPLVETESRETQTRTPPVLESKEVMTEIQEQSQEIPGDSDLTTDPAPDDNAAAHDQPSVAEDSTQGLAESKDQQSMPGSSQGVAESDGDALADPDSPKNETPSEPTDVVRKDSGNREGEAGHKTVEIVALSDTVETDRATPPEDGNGAGTVNTERLSRATDVASTLKDSGYSDAGGCSRMETPDDATVGGASSTEESSLQVSGLIRKGPSVDAPKELLLKTITDDLDRRDEDDEEYEDRPSNYNHHRLQGPKMDPPSLVRSHHADPDNRGLQNLDGSSKSHKQRLQVLRRSTVTEEDEEEYEVDDSRASMMARQRRARARPALISPEFIEERDEDGDDRFSTYEEPQQRDISSASMSRGLGPLTGRHYYDEGLVGGGGGVPRQVSVTQAVQNNLRKYQVERRIFQELLELKRMQIRAGRSNEQVLVKRLSDNYTKSIQSIVGLRSHDGPYTFKEFEKYLFGQLRLCQYGRPSSMPSLSSRNLSREVKVFVESRTRPSSSFNQLRSQQQTSRMVPAPHYLQRKQEELERLGVALRRHGIECTSALKHAYTSYATGSDGRGPQVTVESFGLRDGDNEADGNDEDDPSICTHSTHRCHHAAHAYTGLPCSHNRKRPKAAVVLPRIEGGSSGAPRPASSIRPSGEAFRGASRGTELVHTSSQQFRPGSTPLTLELLHGGQKQSVSLPTDQLDRNKKYLITFTINRNVQQTETRQLPGGPKDTCRIMSAPCQSLSKLP